MQQGSSLGFGWRPGDPPQLASNAFDVRPACMRCMVALHGQAPCGHAAGNVLLRPVCVHTASGSAVALQLLRLKSVRPQSSPGGLRRATLHDKQRGVLTVGTGRVSDYRKGPGPIHGQQWRATAERMY